MCCTRLAVNIGRKNNAKKSPSAHHSTNLTGYILASKACIDKRARKRLAKQQYLFHTSSQYGELWPLVSHVFEWMNRTREVWIPSLDFNNYWLINNKLLQIYREN